MNVIVFEFLGNSVFIDWLDFRYHFFLYFFKILVARLWNEALVDDFIWVLFLHEEFRFSPRTIVLIIVIKVNEIWVIYSFDELHGLFDFWPLINFFLERD